MNQQYPSPCPNCGTNVWDNEVQCHNCHKYIERCKGCRAPIDPERDTCSRCGAFVADEPLLQARILLSGDLLAGREMILKVAVRNTGNERTECNYSFKLPEPLGKEEIKGEDIMIEPGSTIEREYHLVPPRPGQYGIPPFEVFYKKKNGDETSIKVAPVKFQIDGVPVINLNTEMAGSEVKLGDEVFLFVHMLNEGTASAKNLKFKAFTPPTLSSSETHVVLPSLDVDEERTGVIKLRPLFDGEHNFEVRLQYQTPPIQKSGPRTEEISSDSMILKVKK